MTGRFHVNSSSAAVALATSGIGLAYVPSFTLRGAVKSGDLVALLDEFRSESGPVGAAYLEGRTRPRKVRALIDFALHDLKSLNPLQAL